jgi:hypothetical protein
MSDDKTVEAPPVPITMIGTGPGTDLTGMVGITPKGKPNIIVTSVVHPMFAILIRFIHLYLVTFVGLVTAGLTPLGEQVIQFHDFWSLLASCSLVSLPGPMLGALKDLITIFGDLESKFPRITGQI